MKLPIPQAKSPIFQVLGQKWQVVTMSVFIFVDKLSYGIGHEKKKIEFRSHIMEYMGLFGKDAACERDEF